MENAKTLVERLRTDKALRDRIQGLATIEERLGLAAYLGYRCTSEQIKKAWDSYG